MGVIVLSLFIFTQLQSSALLLPAAYRRENRGWERVKNLYRHTHIQARRHKTAQPVMAELGQELKSVSPKGWGCLAAWL